MKRVIIIGLILISAGIIKSHSQDFYIHFSASYRCSPVDLDSIFIENLNNGSCTTLYYPNHEYSIVVNRIDRNFIKKMQVSQIYPNPFNGEAKFDIIVHTSGQYQMKIFDLPGRLLTKKTKLLDPGKHHFTFFACTQRVYVLKVSSNDQFDQKVMIQNGIVRGSVSNISYNGMSSHSHDLTSNSQSRLKSANGLQFQPGDELRMTGYITNYSAEVKSHSITDTPWVSKEYHFDILNSAPNQPLSIAGPTEVNSNQTDITYSVTEIPELTWEWSVPSEWSITSEQGNNSITVDAGPSSGNITVVAINACGSSPAEVLSVTVENNGSGSLPDASFYVSPTGRANASGTSSDPYNLQTALSSNGPAQPGDLIILLEGTYPGRFTSQVKGDIGNPVIFAAEPGKRVTIDGRTGSGKHALTIQGEWVEFRDLEITNSNTNRIQMVGGVEFTASNSKLVNSIIHNNLAGIDFWTSAVNSELYGNIIYNNGFYEGRGRGHGIYTQNRHGTKRIINNILFFGYGYGIHAYAENGYLEGFDFEQNVWFRTGASLEGSSLEGNYDGLLIGGHQPVDRTSVYGNHSWSPATYSRNARFGWSGTVGPDGSETLWNESIELKDNYFVGNVATQGYWREAVVENNYFYSISSPQSSEFPNNTYSLTLPKGTKAVIQPNKYDPNRIDIIIYNWTNSNQVHVDVNEFLENGKSYQIYSVFDLWNNPVAIGAHQGNPISIPMGTVAPPQPNGFPNAITGNDNPGRTFGVFVLRLR